MIAAGDAWSETVTIARLVEALGGQVKAWRPAA